jgi:two-component system OmpR family sensor kinase
MLDMQKDKMRTYGAELAFKAIKAHMTSTPFLYINSTKFKIAMYSNRKNILYGEEIEDIEFDYPIYLKGDALYVIDQSAQQHLGIKYIVLKDTTIFEEIEGLKYKVIIYTLIALFFVGVVGYFLGRLFLKPIANERERLDKFIKDTTHELNTPISALLMSVSSLKDEDSKIKERIKLSANRISNIYDDLCYLLKDELNESPQIKDINLKEILEEQLLLLETYAKSKKIEIKLDSQNTIFKIDEESAKRLINNILSNALKYSKPNTTIEITLKEKQLKVKDQGVGIDQDSLKSIKNRYYRANKSEGGFGIGLDIVNSICKKYDIKLEIESKKDEGTSVVLNF